MEPYILAVANERECDTWTSVSCAVDRVSSVDSKCGTDAKQSKKQGEWHCTPGRREIGLVGNGKDNHNQDSRGKELGIEGADVWQASSWQSEEQAGRGMGTNNSTYVIATLVQGDGVRVVGIDEECRQHGSEHLRYNEARNLASGKATEKRQDYCDSRITVSTRHTTGNPHCHGDTDGPGETALQVVSIGEVVT